MTPKSLHFSLWRYDESIRVYFVINSKFSKNVISFAADLDNVPDLQVDESESLIASPRKILIEIEVIVFPKRNNFLIINHVAAGLPLNVVAMKAK
jgi:hypothetical protein